MPSPYLFDEAIACHTEWLVDDQAYTQAIEKAKELSEKATLIQRKRVDFALAKSHLGCKQCSKASQLFQELIDDPKTPQSLIRGALLGYLSSNQADDRANDTIAMIDRMIPTFEEDPFLSDLLLIKASKGTTPNYAF